MFPVKDIDRRSVIFINTEAVVDARRN